MKFIYIKMSALSPCNLYLNFIVDHILAGDKKKPIFLAHLREFSIESVDLGNLPITSKFADT